MANRFLWLDIPTPFPTYLTPDPTGEVTPHTPNALVVGSGLKFDQGSVQIHIYHCILP